MFVLDFWVLVNSGGLIRIICYVEMLNEISLR